MRGGVELKGESVTRYFCEKHFSERDFFFNSRRKLLLRTAVPAGFEVKPDPAASFYSLMQPIASSTVLEKKEEKQEEMQDTMALLDHLDLSESQQPVEAEEERAEVEDKLQGFSKFIFNNEKYVQMPERIFQAEMEKMSKLKKMNEEYRQNLNKFKAQLNALDLEWRLETPDQISLE